MINKKKAGLMTGFFYGYIFRKRLYICLYIIKINNFMIKYDKVLIEINKGNLPYYSNKCDKKFKIGDFVEIEVNILPNNSNIEIMAVCDFCESDILIKYKLYNKSFDKNGSFACSRKCAAIRTKNNLMNEYGVTNISQVNEVKEKIKKTNLEKWGSENYFGSEFGKNKNKEIFIEKYGVDNPLKVNEVKEKIKKTNLEKWGVEFTLQNKNIRDKIIKTNLEKWGVETPSKCEDVKNKIIETNNKKWGGNSPMCNDLIKEKSSKTTFKNWGVYNPNHSDIIRDKIKKTNLIKLGFEYPSQSPLVKDKIKKNNLIKWGTEHVHQSNIYRIENTNIGKNKFYIEYKGDKVSIFRCDCGKDHNFEINTDNFYSRTNQNIKLCTVCYPISDKKSFLENELFKFLSSVYTGEIIQSYRDGLEIDIYLPDLKLGFEFNGLYWHSDKYRDKSYHLEKTKYFNERGIRIIHIWEDDWCFKNEIIKSQIKNKLFLNDKKIFARKCQVLTLDDKKVFKDFLNTNHIQGVDKSSLKLGLFFDDDLVSVMTFDKFEGRQKMEDGGWNLSRFCNKLNTNVIGGAGKLLKYFINNYDPSRIVSYADRDWSEGDLYYKLGFSLINESKPDYKYLVDGKRVHKSNFKKNKFSISESEYVKSLNILKVWDCGKLKFSLYL